MMLLLFPFWPQYTVHNSSTGILSLFSFSYCLSDPDRYKNIYPHHVCAQLAGYNSRHTCLQYSIHTHTHPCSTTTPSCHNLLESLCMTFSLFLQPIEVKITVGWERAEWLYISKITVGIHHCHRDTPTEMNLVKWVRCIGQGALTVTNAPPMVTNRSVQIGRGL